MLKYILTIVLLTLTITTWAAPSETDDVTLDEIQTELDAMDENMSLDDEDVEFLANETLKQDKNKEVVWGKAVEPKKNAQAPQKTNTKKQ